MLPQFKCVGIMRCIPSTWYCNGIEDCSDGSDEWGCGTSSMDSTIIKTIPFKSEDNNYLYIKTEVSKILRDIGVTATTDTHPESEDTISLYIQAKVNEILRDKGVRTTSKTYPESGNPISSYIQREVNEILGDSGITTTSKTQPESENTISSYIQAKVNEILRDKGVRTTSKTYPESGNPISSYIQREINEILGDNGITTTSKTHPESENTISSYIQAKVNEILWDKGVRTTSKAYPESGNPISSYIQREVYEILRDKGITTTSKTHTESEDNASSLPPTTTTLLPQFESKDGFLSSRTRVSIMNQDSDSDTALTLSATTDILNSGSELNFAPSSSLVLINSKVPFSGDESDIVPEFKENNAFPEIYTVFPESSAKESCPDNYCAENAECIVVQGQYHCKCPYPFTGELCTIRLDNEDAFHEYAVEMAISITLAILCLAVVLMCIYRYKRSSSWKFKDRTSKTSSQSTLIFNTVE